MTINELGNLSYYNKQVKDFTNEEKKLFIIDNELLLCIVEQQLSKHNGDFMGFGLNQIKGHVLSEVRMDTVCELLGMDDELKKNYTKKELIDMCENSDYSFKGYKESHEKNQDKIEQIAKDNGIEVEVETESTPNNMNGFSMN